MSVPLSPVLVGVDGSDTIQVIYASVAEDPQPLRLKVPSDLAGLRQLLDALDDRWPGRPRIFGVENPTALFARALQARGEDVRATNPHAVMNLRKGLHPSGKKDDPVDARAIAVFLREHLAELPPPAASSAEGELLAARVAERADLVRQKTRLLNQLTALLKESFPVVLGVFSKLDQEVTLAFLARFPGPAAVQALTPAAWLAFLQEHRYPRAAVQGPKLWEKLTQAQLTAPETVEVINQPRRQRLLEQLCVLRRQIRELEAEIEALFAKHPDQELFSSLPGSGPVLAPAVLAVFGDNRQAWQSVAHLAAQAGTVPVTRRSGQQVCINMRQHCDKERRYLLHLFAGSTVAHCPWAGAFYRQQRARGIPHNTALRNLATKWLRIIWRMWHDQKAYDPTLIRQRTAPVTPTPAANPT